MNEDKKYIDMTPNWYQAAQIYIAALLNGTDKGQRAATQGVLEMGANLDKILTRVKELETELEKKADVTVAVEISDGLFNRVISNVPVNVFVLEDRGDEGTAHEIKGKTYQVNEESADVDPEYISTVSAKLDEE